MKTNLFFDTEFTGLHKNTTLISIGIVSDGGQTFYAEFNDYDESQCDDWVKANVLPNLMYPESGVADKQFYGSRKNVSSALKDWLQQFDEIQFVSDTCHYDFLLLIDLFGTAFDLPNNISPVCHDINQDIAKYYDVSDKMAFEMTREYIVEELYGEVPYGKKHTALYDAQIIRLIYKRII